MTFWHVERCWSHFSTTSPGVPGCTTTQVLQMAQRTLLASNLCIPGSFVKNWSRSSGVWTFLVKEKWTLSEWIQGDPNVRSSCQTTLTMCFPWNRTVGWVRAQPDPLVAWCAQSTVSIKLCDIEVIAQVCDTLFLWPLHATALRGGAGMSQCLGGALWCVDHGIGCNGSDRRTGEDASVEL